MRIQLGRKKYDLIETFLLEFFQIYKTQAGRIFSTETEHLRCSFEAYRIFDALTEATGIYCRVKQRRLCMHLPKTRFISIENKPALTFRASQNVINVIIMSYSENNKRERKN